MLSGERTLGVMLTYPEAGEETQKPASRIVLPRPANGEPARGVAGLLGAGSFARRTLIPAIQSAGIRIKTVVSSTGLSAAVEGRRAGAALASSDHADVFADPEIDTVFVLTRHDSHADLVVRALEAGKHVFVEKPLALSLEGLARVEQAAHASDRLLMVGFNRRFAPLATRLKTLTDGRAGPLSLVITVNAGWIEPDHWTQDPRQGGGRIVGEACHFIDLARWLTGESITRVSVQAAADSTGAPLDDVAHITLALEGGSTAAIHYLATGSSRFPKERVEAFFDGKTAAIDNWRRLRTWGLSGGGPRLGRRLDKGHESELEALAAAIRSGTPSPIPLGELLEVSRWSIRAASLARGDSATSA
ncbi:MAG: Gfo/Idh/MocA family protein, partial [Gemmatimonadota bacterium]